MSFGAVILAGGNSRRMGESKADLTFEGQTFLGHTVHELRGFEERFLSLSAPTEAKYEIDKVYDIYKSCGPMGGLHAALARCTSDALLAVSCDLPLFCRELGEYLCSLLTPDCDAVVPVTSDGRIHLLCAVYRKSVHEILERLLKRGEYCLKLPLEEISVRYVHMENTPFSERLLKNINTPEEYRELIKEGTQNEDIS